jgi:selenide,water dikinase
VEGALAHLDDGRGLSGGGRRNRSYAEDFTSFAGGVSEALRALVCDPVTSGGLLVAVAPARAPQMAGAVIGRLLEGPAGTISLI